MDYRKSLFQIEQWTPLLAKKIWGLGPLLNTPFNFLMGFKTSFLTDQNVEVKIPAFIQNRNENGEIDSAVFLSAAVFCSKVLWKRHLRPSQDDILLSEIQSSFFKSTLNHAFVRAEIKEVERELVLRKLNLGEEVDHEMTAIVSDTHDQVLARIYLKWKLKPSKGLQTANHQIAKGVL